MINGNACFAYFNKSWGIPLHSKRRLIRRMVPTATPNCLAITRTPGRSLALKLLDDSHDWPGPCLGTPARVCRRDQVEGSLQSLRGLNGADNH